MQVHIIVCTPGRMIDLLCANSGRVTNLQVPPAAPPYSVLLLRPVVVVVLRLRLRLRLRRAPARLELA